MKCQDRNAERNEAIKQLVVKGYSAKEIAEKLNISLMKVYGMCAYYGLKLKPVKKMRHCAYLSKSGRYYCIVHAYNGRYRLGTFAKEERAVIAAKLWHHWVKRGYKPWKIPTATKTRDAV